jgi:hypothetical protein
VDEPASTCAAAGVARPAQAVRLRLRRGVRRLMAVHVEEISSSVSAEPEPGTTGLGHQRSWDLLAQFAVMRERIAEDHVRTQAEGFDD